MAVEGDLLMQVRCSRGNKIDARGSDEYIRTEDVPGLRGMSSSVRITIR